MKKFSYIFSILFFCLYIFVNNKVHANNIIKASDVIYNNGQTVEEINNRNKLYSNFKFTPTSDDFNYKIESRCSKFLLHIYAVRNNEAYAVLKCIIDSSNVNGYLNNSNNNIGAAIGIIPSYVSPGIYNIRITNVNGMTVFVEKQIIE